MHFILKNKLIIFICLKDNQIYKKLSFFENIIFEIFSILIYPFCAFVNTPFDSASSSIGRCTEFFKFIFLKYPKLIFLYLTNNCLVYSSVFNIFQKIF